MKFWSSEKAIVTITSQTLWEYFCRLIWN